MVRYAQFRSIADEMVVEFGVGQGQHFTVSLESELQKTIFENILLEILRERGADARLLGGVGHKEDSVLRAVVVTQEIGRRDSGDGVIVRSTETILDARIETPSGEIPRRKMFRRISVDTLGSAYRAKEISVFERLLEPAIVITGALLVVYLLFTVRSS
ncbi:MAG: hypothetical protein WEF53_04955 [Bacteroidota bacterium]